ncbi:hypothetical protein NIES37_02530 [Tolypothrix tenuis PCC 7101]|uniref:SMODS and SLOG-associating 2TM effector domain-containing protein n=1 Tax=Tolypothrix tenuis PCC 7101 TaxID=231146 RepID=A0A1Z4MSE5_9CYAN|nr:hypothetical protein [Aulosira sp. FACHB-113]BAY96321.1 hypothetical protein NIES37_02530 [Tolypothrix tenuis PCC 7101]BAZ73172.1 hypothetical protein NIES50_17310 [Aulosira laxa NIES-50]
MSSQNEIINNNQELKNQIKAYRNAYKARFIRNQYTNNIIITLSILLTVLIAITGTSPTFKDTKNPWAAPLGVSASAWLGLISTALISLQRLYNVQEKIAFYPSYIVKAEELIEDFDAIKTEEDLELVRKQFRQMRADEAIKRPIERSNS